jgi:hypothetical protein
MTSDPGYGKGSLSPGNKLAHWAVGTPAMFAVPVISDFESQNKSTPLPPIRVVNELELTPMVDRFAATERPF